MIGLIIVIINPTKFHQNPTKGLKETGGQAKS